MPDFFNQITVLFEMRAFTSPDVRFYGKKKARLTHESVEMLQGIKVFTSMIILSPRKEQNRKTLSRACSSFLVLCKCLPRH